MKNSPITSYDIKLFKRICWAIFLSAGFFYLIFIFRTGFHIDGKLYFTLFDDAMISMRYAQNLADGYGLVWNPGEIPVEGYTNFLWTLILSIAHLFPVTESKVSLIVMFYGVIILYVNMYLIMKISLKVSDGNFLVSIASVLFTGFYYPLVFWTLRGMEVGLLSLLSNFSILLYFSLSDKFNWRLFYWCNVSIALAILVRMDAVVFSIIVLSFTIFTVPPQFKTKAIYIAVCTIVIPILLLVCFRLSYYGEWLPNTAYLKLNGFTIFERVVRGIKVYLNFLRIEMKFPLLLLLISLYLGIRNRTDGLFNWKILLLPAVFIGQSVYSIYVGGDAWEWAGYANRFISMATPVFFVFLFEIISLVSKSYFFKLKPHWYNKKSNRIVFYIIITLILPLYCFAVNYHGLVNWYYSNGIHAKHDEESVKLALALRAATAEKATLAVGWAGAIPYFSKRKCIDLLGKNDKIIARMKPIAGKELYPGHNKWDYLYSIGEFHPDVIVQNMGYTKKDLELLKSLKYNRLKNGMSVLSNSPYVNHKLLENIEIQ